MHYIHKRPDLHTRFLTNNEEILLPPRPPPSPAFHKQSAARVADTAAAGRACLKTICSNASIIHQTGRGLAQYCSSHQPAITTPVCPFPTLLRFPSLIVLEACTQKRHPRQHWHNLPPRFLLTFKRKTTTGFRPRESREKKRKRKRGRGTKDYSSQNKIHITRYIKRRKKKKNETKRDETKENTAYLQKRGAGFASGGV